MAVVNRNSQGVALQSAFPPVAVDYHLSGHNIREASGIITPEDGDSIGSVGRFVRIPSNCRPVQFLVWNEAYNPGVHSVRFGLYETEENGGEVVDVSFFSFEYGLTAGITNGDPDQTHRQASSPPTFTIDQSEKLLWEILGLSEDPHKEYDVCYTIIGADFTNVNGPIRVAVRYGH